MTDRSKNLVPYSVLFIYLAHVLFWAPFSWVTRFLWYSYEKHSNISC